MVNLADKVTLMYSSRVFLRQAVAPELELNYDIAPVFAIMASESARRCCGLRV
jgi:hypothetical protein